MAKLADAADLKSADPKGLWGFKSPSRHQPIPVGQRFKVEEFLEDSGLGSGLCPSLCPFC
jgi:hypothetical protein